MNNQQACDNCGKSFIFMKLYPRNDYANPYDGQMVCQRCLEYDKRRKR
jgi:hypothetical protein